MIPDLIKKRDGRIVPFEEDNIRTNIKRALEASNTDYPAALLYDLLEVRYLFNYKSKTISVEELSDFVEEIFMREGLYDAARAYITYRFQRKLFREKKDVVSKIVDEYIGKKTWRVNENSNITYSYPAMQGAIANNVISNYVLSSIYPNNISEAHIQGDFHIHDLAMGTAGYCAGWDLRTLLLEGFGGVSGKLNSRPPSHLTSAVDQMINFLGVLQNEWAGAMAYNSFDTFLAPYVKLDELDKQTVKQCMENFVYGVNVTSRWGQSPFTNITLDLRVPTDLAKDPVIIAGKEVGFTYGDCQAEVDLINEAFWEVMLEGDASNLPFTFPIPTVNITKDFDWDSKIANLIFEVAGKYGLPYFQNFINSDLDPSDVRSMCCRLRLSLVDLRKHTGGIFGANSNTGSIGVVTINLPRLGFTSTNEEELFEKLENLAELAKESLVLKRKVVNENLERGLFPYTKRYLGTFKHHFSTIGVVGGHDMCVNFLNGKGIDSPEGKDLVTRILSFLRTLTERFTEETGDLFNLEAAPCEGASYRLASADKKQFPLIITSGEDVPFYTNSSHLPVNYSTDLFETLDHQDSLQCLYSSGTVLHAFVGERVTSDGAKLLVKKICSSYKLPFFSITPTFSVCPDHKYLSGEHPTCPHCGKDSLIFSRVVGYLRSVDSWNLGKKEEFKHRKTYVV